MSDSSSISGHVIYKTRMLGNIPGKKGVFKVELSTNHTKWATFST